MRVRTTAFVAVLALLSAATVSVVEPSRAHAAQGYEVICPDPVMEGDTAEMQVLSTNWFRGPRVYTFTRNHTASLNDFTPWFGRRGTPDGRTLRIPIETTEDARPEHDETFSIGFFSGWRLVECVVVIVDDDRPRIIGVDFASSPAGSVAYRAGDAIDVAVRLDRNVEAEGVSSACPGRWRR